MLSSKNVLVLEENIALGLDITWKLGHLGWKVIWVRDFHQAPQSIQNIQVLLYSANYASDNLSEFDDYLHHYEDCQVPIGIIPTIQASTSSISPSSNCYTKLDYPFKLSNLKDVLDHLVEQSYQKNELQNKISLLKKVEKIRHQVICSTIHEVRTPINIILFAIENIESMVENMSIDTLEIEHIKSAFQEIQEIITTLEDSELSYPYLNDSQPAQQVDICALCKQIVANFYLSLPFEKRTQNKISINHSQEEIFVIVEPNLFKRILMNLILNAIKFSPDNQEIVITLEMINQELKLCIYDRGIGIHPDDLKYITEPFYRSRNAVNFSGSGLGLSIVEACVTSQRGRIKIESQLGTGTCVTVFLPTEIM